MCLDVNLGSTNRNRCTQKLVMLYTQTHYPDRTLKTGSVGPTLRVKIACRKKVSVKAFARQLSLRARV